MLPTVADIPFVRLDFETLSLLPKQFGRGFAIALGQCLLLVCLAQVVLRAFLNGPLKRLKATVQQQFIWPDAKAVEVFFHRCCHLLTAAAWLGIAVVCLRLLGAPQQAIAMGDWLFGAFLAIALSTLIVQTLPLSIATLDALLLNTSASRIGSLLYFYPRLRSLVPLLKQCLKLTIYTGTAGLIFQNSPPLKELAPFANQIVVTIFIYFLAQVAIEITRLVIDEWVNAKHHVPGTQDSEFQKLQTFAPILKDGCKYLIYLGALVFVLGVFQVDVAPILASIGTLGVAFSLGAQNLVQDVIAGLFLLFDETYAVGDYIQGGRLEERSVEGVVEAIELRTTRLRHPNGQVQLIRNSAMGSVVNYSKNYAYATVNVALDPGETLEEVYALIEQVGQSLQQQYPEAVIEGTQVEGLESLSKHRIVLRTLTKVYPGQHQYVQRLLRQRLKMRFDQLDQERQAYEQQTQAYAAEFSETGVKSLVTSKRSLRNQAMSGTEQNTELASQTAVLRNPDFATLKSSTPEIQGRKFRRGSSLSSLLQRVWSLFRSAKRK